MECGSGGAVLGCCCCAQLPPPSRRIGGWRRRAVEGGECATRRTATARSRTRWARGADGLRSFARINDRAGGRSASTWKIDRAWSRRLRGEALIVAREEREGTGGGEETAEAEEGEDVEAAAADDGPNRTTTPPFTVKDSGWLLASTDFWLQVGIFVLAAGFVDAGFSGDWSRIGVVSKETESDLQIAAIGVVPLAVALIWSISQRRKILFEGRNINLEAGGIRDLLEASIAHDALAKTKPQSRQVEVTKIQKRGGKGNRTESLEY